MDKQHDKGFRAMLDNAAVFAELLVTFIGEGEQWTELISSEALERVNASFVTDTFEKREADIIYKLKGPSGWGREVYFYCLLEMQSSVDYSMPLRLFIYMANFWSSLLKNIPDAQIARSGFRLPLIIPVVLYNGKDAWTVPREFAALYGEEGSLFKDYALNFKYYLIDVNAYPAEALLETGSFLSAVFYMDQKTVSVRTPEYCREIREKLHRIEPMFGHFSVQERNLLLHWMQEIVLDRMRMQGDSALVQQMQEKLDALGKETELEMFVSNFEAEFTEFWSAFTQSFAEAAEVKQQLTASEQQLTAAVQELSTAKQRLDTAEQRLSTAEQRLRESALAMKELGIPADIIAQKTGLSQEEIEKFYG